jgi:hypothetical protein
VPPGRGSRRHSEPGGLNRKRSRRRQTSDVPPWSRGFLPLLKRVPVARYQPALAVLDVHETPEAVLISKTQSGSENGSRTRPSGMGWNCGRGTTSSIADPLAILGIRRRQDNNPASKARRDSSRLRNGLHLWLAAFVVSRIPTSLSRPR